MNTEIKKEHEQEFLNTLVALLQDSYLLSQIDLQTKLGEHRSHSALVENYEINIARTPVFVTRSGLGGLFGRGDWKFEPAKYERYELCISENKYNLRLQDFDNNYENFYQRKVMPYNIILFAGTMATAEGSFWPKRRAVSMDRYNDLYVNQNSHLFYNAYRLYEILDNEYLRRTQNIKEYDLSSPYNDVFMRMKLLSACRRQANIQNKDKTK